MHLDAVNTASYSGSGTTWTDLSGNGNNNPAVGDTAGLALTVTYTAAANGAYVIKAGDRIQFDYFY
jgi:hypothetical protein